jgi:prevent-host-death family protein
MSLRHYTAQIAMRMGLREANQHFSRAVKVVKAGREVVLTERGRPVAVIRPLRSTAPSLAAIERLASEGRLRLAEKPGPIRRRGWRPVRTKGPPLSQALREERDAR